MSKAGSKKDTMISAMGVKSAVILFEADCYLSSILIHTQSLPNISSPANLGPQFLFVPSTAHAKNGKLISVEQFSGALISVASSRERIPSFTALDDKSAAVVWSPIFETLQKAKAGKFTLGLVPR